MKHFDKEETMERTLTLKDYCKPYISDLKVEDENGRVIARGSTLELLRILDDDLLNRKVANFRNIKKCGKHNYDTAVILCAEEEPEVPEADLPKVLWVESGKSRVVSMELDDESLKAAGFTKTLYPFKDEFVAVICKDSPDNCSVSDMACITGPFIITSLRFEGLGSLSDEQIEKFGQLFAA